MQTLLRTFQKNKSLEDLDKIDLEEKMVIEKIIERTEEKETTTEKKEDLEDKMVNEETEMKIEKREDLEEKMVKEEIETKTERIVDQEEIMVKKKKELTEVAIEMKEEEVTEEEITDQKLNGLKLVLLNQERKELTCSSR